MFIVHNTVLRRKERVGRGGQGASASLPHLLPHHFIEQKHFLHVKLENIKFLHVNNMYLNNMSLFIKAQVSKSR